MSLLDDIQKGIQTAADVSSGKQAAATVRIESSLFPPIVISAADLQGGAGEEPNWLTKLVKPRIIIESVVGSYTVAPAGAPPSFPWVGAIAAVGVVVGGIFFWKKFRR